MAQAEQTIRNITDIENIGSGETWLHVPANVSQMHRIIVTLGRECKDWPHGSTELEIQQLIQDNSQPEDLVLYTNGSVVRGFKSCLSFLTEANGQILAEESRVYDMTTLV